jgi:hypothetical protein
MEGGMQRAKMSTGSNKGVPGVSFTFWDGFVGTSEQRAEFEARSILAETEPVRPFTGEPDPYAYMMADWPGFRGSQYASALAESIAAFVEGN